jgi:hypothetical protein
MPDLAVPAAAPARSFAEPWQAATAAALLSLGAAWVHLAYWESHWREWWGYGVFFLATGAAQALFAPAIVRRPRPWLLLAGIAGNLAIVGTYVLSRTEGVPVGTHAGVAERAGAADLATTAAEIVLVGVLLAMAGRTARRVIINTMLLAGALLWALRLTGHLP